LASEEKTKNIRETNPRKEKIQYKKKKNHRLSTQGDGGGEA